jgi:hypothetical protein
MFTRGAFFGHAYLQVKAPAIADGIARKEADSSIFTVHAVKNQQKDKQLEYIQWCRNISLFKSPQQTQNDIKVKEEKEVETEKTSV